MKKVIVPLVVILVLTAIVTASVLKNRDAGKGIEVYAEATERRDISKIVKASGQIDPRVKVNVSAHVVAKIERLYVEEGQEVEKGEPFLELERETFQAARQQAAAQLEIAKTQLRQARIDLADARLKLERARRLQGEGIASAESLEAASLAEQSAELRVDQAAEAIRQARASLDKAEDDLRKATLYAPLTGRVIALEAEEGEVVVSGTMNNPASVIGVVADLSEILAEVDVDETEIVNVELGQPARVVVDAIPDFEYAGEVVEIASSGFSRPQQPDVTFFKVKVLLQDPDARLRPGMSSRAEIEVATHRDTLVVPIQAVMFRKPIDAAGEEADEIKVAFVIEEGRAMQRPITVGITDTTHAELLTGVDEAQQVVTGPSRVLKTLEHEAEVNVEEAEDDEAEEEE